MITSMVLRMNVNVSVQLLHDLEKIKLCFHQAAHQNNAEVFSSLTKASIPFGVIVETNSIVAKVNAGIV